MAKDDFKNLGFGNQSKPAAEPEKGVKGELHW